MAFDSIQPAAFVPNPNSGPFQVEYETLAFPAAWRTPILDLYKHGKSEQWQAKIKQVPIQRLNATLRAVAPDLVTVGANASFDEDRPWLYADKQWPHAVLDSFITAWLRDLQPSEEAYPLVRDTALKLRSHAPVWKRRTVDMLEQTLSPGHTAQPADHLYRLLPETIADRIATLPPYEHCGQRLSFRRVAVDARANGAELMSWPPLPHETKSKGEGTRTWQYSAVIRVSLRTTPFAPVPRIHLHTGIRRWVNGPVWTLPRRGVSAYLLAETPLVPGGHTPSRFAAAQIIWDPKTGKTEWRQGGPEGMLLRISALDNLPPIDVFIKEPETWADGRDGVTAAVAYQTMMGYHAVGAGLMPSERRRLVEWAAQALEPEFRPIGKYQRASITQRNPQPVLERKVSIRKDATHEEREQAEKTNDERAARNAAIHQSRLATAVRDGCLTALMLYQSDTMRDHLIHAAEQHLGLTAHREATGPDLWSWRVPGKLAVRIHARRLGALGAPLGDGKPLRRNDESDKAISQRRQETTSFLDQLAEGTAEMPSVAFIELHGKEGFTQKGTDPKFALRLGCADRRVVTQFLRPRDPDVADENDDSAFRAAAAWADGLRQVGMRLVPEHSLGNTIPENLTQLAFWMVKRRADHDQMRRRQFTPVAILINPDQDCIMGKTAEMQDWVPYPELLTALAGKLRSDELKTAEQQEEAAAAFIKKTLSRMRGQPTLVITHAQNTRNRWPWLQNSGLVADKIQIGAGPLQRLALYGKQLRIARIATNDRDETPQWWAPKNEDEAGIAKNLWIPASAPEDNRVFYSTTNKASTHTLGVNITKLTPRATDSGKIEPPKPASSAWNPELLEITMAGLAPGDNPEHWAMFLHQQRQAEDYRDNLALPLILHLAKLASHYALPHEDDDDPIPVKEETDVEEQLEFTFDEVDE